MFLRKAVRMSMKKKVLFLALPVFACSSAAAVAAGGWTVVIGTSGNDTINESGNTGNYRIWGLAGHDVLTGSQGSNFIVGDGHCRENNNAVTTGQDDEYCDTAEVKGDAGDELTGGGGDNVEIGGGGPNVIRGGNGHNTIFAGSATNGTSAGTGNLIYGGQHGDAIDAVSGTSAIYPGAGTNYVDTQGAADHKDYVYCIKGDKGTTVYAKPSDVVQNCAHVSRSNPSRDRASSKHKRHSTKRKPTRQHASAKRSSSRR